MILGHGANTMTMEEAKAKLCAQAKYVINWLTGPSCKTERELAQGWKILDKYYILG